MTKLIYNYDQDGYFIGSQKADLDPLENKIKKTKVYLLPSNATFTKMKLDLVENKRIKWNGKKWVYEDILPIQDDPEPTEEEKIKQLKDNAIVLRKDYIHSKDWYITREYDQPNSYPIDIKNQRILARSQINEIEKIDNLTDAQNIEKDYEFLIDNKR